jgi:hypothetical protein
MSTPRTNPAAPLPRWVVLAGSGLIAFHFFAIVAYVLAASSGPWPTAFGSSPALAPFFLKDPTPLFDPNRLPNEYSAREIYLRLLHLDHDFHFQSNHTDNSAVYFEARLRNKAGEEMGTLKFPQEKANFWVRHRQALLAMGLGNDRPVEGSRGNPIPAPGKKLEETLVWDPVNKEKLENEFKNGKITKVQLEQGLERLKPGENHRLKKMQTISPEQELMGPSSRSILLAKSYARYLGRLHHAASVELIRHSRNPIFPDVVFANRQKEIQGKNERFPYMQPDMVANFGVEEIRDEK